MSKLFSVLKFNPIDICTNDSQILAVFPSLYESHIFFHSLIRCLSLGDIVKHVLRQRLTRIVQGTVPVEYAGVRKIWELFHTEVKEFASVKEVQRVTLQCS